jgi:hypothetical protein
MPGSTLSEPDPQDTRLAASHAPGAHGCLIHLLKNPARIIEKRRSRRAYSHSARQAVKQFDTNFLFQVLDLARKSGLGKVKPVGSATVMLFLTDSYEIAQMPEFHINTSTLPVRYKRCLGRMHQSMANLTHETQTHNKEKSTAQEGRKAETSNIRSQG